MNRVVHTAVACRFLYDCWFCDKIYMYVYIYIYTHTHIYTYNIMYKSIGSKIMIWWRFSKQQPLTSVSRGHLQLTITCAVIKTETSRYVNSWSVWSAVNWMNLLRGNVQHPQNCGLDYLIVSAVWFWDQNWWSNTNLSFCKRPNWRILPSASVFGVNQVREPTNPVSETFIC